VISLLDLMADSSTSRRIAVVGVIGGEDRSGCARLVGRELAKNRCVVLSGGCPIDNRNETKYAAIMGALDAEKHGEGIARFIGIMSKSDKQSFNFECLTRRQLIIHTGLSSLDRDPINGTTPDVLVCFDGGPGTICELAFGIAVGRDAVFHGHCAQNLLDKCIQRHIEIKQTLSQVAAKWQTHLQLPDSVGDAFINILTDYLRKAAGRIPLTSATTIVQAALQFLPNQLPDIPAFSGVLDSCRSQQHQHQFAVYWAALSADTDQE
jgi:predicted Rossmann-fold nucleotide-binding protein